MHASGTLEPPAAETTIAVLLGASEYPQKPAWSNPVLGDSARAFRDYVLSPAGLALPSGQVLDLFDDDEGPAEQLLQIKAFLKASSMRARDLVLYYVGHGGFDADDYYLGIRSTQRDHEFITTIESRKLADHSRCVRTQARVRDPRRVLRGERRARLAGRRDRGRGQEDVSAAAAGRHRVSRRRLEA